MDDYAQNLINSGHTMEHVRRIIISGIRGYESKKRRRAAEGRELRLTLSGSRMKRHTDKLLEKSTWFKKRKNQKDDKHTRQGAKSRKEKGREQKMEEHIKYRTVHIVSAACFLKKGHFKLTLTLG